jgi:hypothetical protein
MSLKAVCSICSAWHPRAVVNMNVQNVELIARLDYVKWYGRNRWWVSLRKCPDCLRDWLVAQDERVHDFFALESLSIEQSAAIVESERWPDTYRLYREVLCLGVDAGFAARFVDPLDSSLIATLIDLHNEDPDLTVAAAAHALAIDSDLLFELASAAERKEGVKIQFKWVGGSSNVD